MPRPKANRNFFKVWSSDMAYTLGFIVTDGCLVEHKNGYNALNITNKNIQILRNILRAMDSDHKISAKKRSRTSNLEYFQIQIRDKIIYSDLLKLELTPRKSKTVRMPCVPQKFLGDFIRGCFDGDGTVFMWQDPRWRHAWQMRSGFCSGSYGFLIDVQECLHKEYGLTHGSIQKLKRAHLLCYSIADSIKLYYFIYKNLGNDSLYLKEKKDKFEFFKKVRPETFRKQYLNGIKHGPIV